MRVRRLFFKPLFIAEALSMNPLNTRTGTVITGLILAILLVLLVSGHMGFDPRQFGRWLHIAAGVMWIGLLYYFNFVQVPSMPKIPDAEKPAVSKVIAPAALWWFRWAAMATIIFGLILAGMNGYLGAALSLHQPATAIGIGMWMGIIRSAERRVGEEGRSRG